MVARHPLAYAFVPTAILALVWGCNWPILKISTTEIAPLTFRAITLPFAAAGMFLVARAARDGVSVPREWWWRLTVLAFFNVAAWNGVVLFGLQQLPAGRGVILGYTMPVWATLVATMMLHEPLNRRKAIGLALGTLGMLVLLGDDIRNLRAAPLGAFLILTAAITWAIGTVLLRKWQPPIAQNTLSAWMLLLGWMPLAVAAPFFETRPASHLAHLSAGAWFAIVYNIVLAGALAQWAWLRLARTLPVAISSLASLPVPVVGVLAGMVVLGERPGTAEFVALVLVLASLVAVLSRPSAEPERAEPG